MGVIVNIHEPARVCPPPGYRKLPQVKPDSLANFSDALWGDLVTQLNPLTARLNRGNRTGLGFTLVAFVTTILLEFYSVWWSIGLYTNLTFLFAPIVIVGFILFQFYQVAANAKIDKQIAEIVASDQRFASEGHIVRYITKNTGVCKSKTAQIQRYLEFRTASDRDIEESSGTSPPTNVSSTTNNNNSEAGTLSVVDEQMPTNSGASATTNNNNSAGAPSVVDQMMADLQRPL